MTVSAERFLQSVAVSTGTPGLTTQQTGELQVPQSLCAVLAPPEASQETAVSGAAFARCSRPSCESLARSEGVRMGGGTSQRVQTGSFDARRTTSAVSENHERWVSSGDRNGISASPFRLASGAFEGEATSVLVAFSRKCTNTILYLGE